MNAEPDSDSSTHSKDQFIKIMPKEGKSMIRDIEINVAKMSITLKNMIECTGEKESKPVHLPEISATILDKITDYLNYHFDDPIEDKDSDDEDYNDIKRTVNS